jgi:hypothetical protein
LYYFLGGTPGACFMFIRPSVQVKPIEGDTTDTHRNLDERGPDVAIE